MIPFFRPRRRTGAGVTTTNNPMILAAPTLSLDARLKWARQMQALFNAHAAEMNASENCRTDWMNFLQRIGYLGGGTFGTVFEERILSSKNEELFPWTLALKEITVSNVGIDHVMEILGSYASTFLLANQICPNYPFVYHAAFCADRPHKAEASSPKRLSKTEGFYPNDVVPDGHYLMLVQEKASGGDLYDLFYDRFQPQTYRFPNAFLLSLIMQGLFGLLALSLYFDAVHNDCSLSNAFVDDIPKGTVFSYDMRSPGLPWKIHTQGFLVKIADFGFVSSEEWAKRYKVPEMGHDRFRHKRRSELKLRDLLTFPFLYLRSRSHAVDFEMEPTYRDVVFWLRNFLLKRNPNDPSRISTRMEWFLRSMITDLIERDLNARFGDIHEFFQSKFHPTQLQHFFGARTLSRVFANYKELLLETPMKKLRDYDLALYEEQRQVMVKSRQTEEKNLPELKVFVMDKKNLTVDEHVFRYYQPSYARLKLQDMFYREVADPLMHTLLLWYKRNQSEATVLARALYSKLIEVYNKFEPDIKLKKAEYVQELAGLFEQALLKVIDTDESVLAALYRRFVGFLLNYAYFPASDVTVAGSTDVLPFLTGNNASTYWRISADYLKHYLQTVEFELQQNLKHRLDKYLNLKTTTQLIEALIFDYPSMRYWPRPYVQTLFHAAKVRDTHHSPTEQVKALENVDAEFLFAFTRYYR